MMEQDPRNQAISEPVSDEHLINEETTRLNAGIAEFTCEAKDI